MPRRPDLSTVGMACVSGKEGLENHGTSKVHSEPFPFNVGRHLKNQIDTEHLLDSETEIVLISSKTITSFNYSFCPTKRRVPNMILATAQALRCTEYSVHRGKLLWGYENHSPWL